MSFGKFINFIRTEKGRKYISYFSLAGTLVASSPYYLANGFLIDKYKAAVQMYSNGSEHPITEDVLKLYNTVITETEQPYFINVFVKPFTVFGFDIFSAGTIMFRSGAIIGLPVNFSYKSADDVHKTIKIMNHTVDWLSEDGKKLEKSLILSEKAKKFAIARELSRTQTYEVMFKSFITPIFISCIYTFNRFINDKYHLLKGPIMPRIFSYSLVTTIGCAVLMFTFDTLTVYYEKKSDEAVSNINLEYLEGGIDFYKTMLERNKALRVLMGEAGTILYSMNGNENLNIRSEHLQTFSRLKYLEDKLELVKKGEVKFGAENAFNFLGMKIIDNKSIKPMPKFLGKDL